VRVNEQSALGLPALYRGVSLVADKVAGLDLFVLKNEEQGKQPAPTHPAYKLLRQGGWGVDEVSNRMMVELTVSV